MPKLLTELTTDFSRGMLDDLAATRYPSNVAQEILNGRIQPDGSAMTRDGSIRLHPSAIITDGIGYGAIEFTTAGGTVQSCLFINESFYVSEDSGATWSDETQANVLTGNYYSLVILREGATNYLFAANGAGDVWRWDGTTLDDTPNAPSGVKYLAVYNGRLWYTGHSGVIVQATAIGDHATLATPDGLLVQINTHDGQDTPTGMYQVGPHLLVFDKNSTSYIDGFGEQTLIVAEGATGFSRSVGCIAFRTIQGVGENAVCWLSKRGIEYYAPGAGIKLLTSPGLQTFFSTINRVAIDTNPGRPSAVYDAVSQEYLCALSTTGTQNDRLVVVNLLQRGANWLGAPSIDRIQNISSGTTYTFGDDADGYIESDVAGSALNEDAQGYATLADVGEAIVPTKEDAQGYLESAVTDDLGASLFIAADATRGSAVHSAGYDGFVRKHYGVDLDDMLNDETSGIAVKLSMTTRPFLLGSSHKQKRTRVIHVQTIQSEEVDVTVAVRANGVSFDEQTITLASTALNQPKHGHVRVKADGDQPQVVLTSTDRVRVAAIGLSAEVLRDRY